MRDNNKIWLTWLLFYRFCMLIAGQDDARQDDARHAPYNEIWNIFADSKWAMKVQFVLRSENKKSEEVQAYSQIGQAFWPG